MKAALGAKRDINRFRFNKFHYGLTGAVALAALVFPEADRALAQEALELPQINVTDTRLNNTARRVRSGGGAQAVPGAAGGAAQPDQTGPAYLPANGGGIVGASTTVLGSRDIERAPEATLADILSREAGIQTSSVFGGVNGAGTLIDMRGFGAAGPSNTLVLINGRRQNDTDLAGFDLSTIDKYSIERIEITRGNSGAVLYGDGAVGGVINIVTKTGANTPRGTRVEGGFGSYRGRQGNFSSVMSSGGFSASVFGNAVNSDGWRENNHLRQRVITGDVRYEDTNGSVFLNVGHDYQRLGFPGARNVLGPGDSFTAPYNEFLTNPRGASTPYDFGTKDGWKFTTGFTRMLAPGFELIVDGGIRRKDQTGSYFGGWFRPADAPLSYLDTRLTTSSVTPRVNIAMPLFGLPSKIVTGVDFYKTDYDSSRGMSVSSPPRHNYLLDQKSLAAYWQQNVKILPNTDIGFGGRVQRNDLSARDNFDPSAPFVPGFGGSVGSPLDQAETNRAYHLGVEHHFNPNFTLFGRMAQSFRVPNVDERVAMSPVNAPTSFQLRTQKSHDAEIGVRACLGSLEVQTSYYHMKLTDELAFSPITFANTNLDPTKRKGVETIVNWRINEVLRFRGSLTYTDATYREGMFAGKQVPLVSPWTGSAGIAWNIIDRRLVFDGVVRYAGKRYLDQDNANVGSFMLPSQTVVDVKLGGELENFFWSVSVQNLFDRKLIDYGLDFSYNDFFTGARVDSYSLYPQPGRTYMVKAGLKW